MHQMLLFHIKNEGFSGVDDPSRKILAPRTSRECPRQTSPEHLLNIPFLPSRGRPDLTSKGRPNLKSQGRP